ncbi:hypothetical protein BS78_05G123100 [Paspalum vaginatum]|nr:hypothetical protein BS78_05G123100 [Paspalum vaginatum]
MADDGADANVPGGYFMGAPANKPDQQPPAAAAEPIAEAAGTQTCTPGDYYIGGTTPGRAGPGKPDGEHKRSSFMECFSCLGSGKVAN